MITAKRQAGNVFDDIAIQNNVIYKDPGSQYDFGDVNAIIFGNSSATANFKFDNTNVSNNRIHYNNKWGIANIEIRQKGVNYVESNNLGSAISSDIMPPSVPTALTTTYISDNQIHLAWNASVDNIGVYRYRIYRNGVGNSYSTTTSYVDKNLQPGVSYTIYGNCHRFEWERIESILFRHSNGTLWNWDPSGSKQPYIQVNVRKFNAEL